MHKNIANKGHWRLFNTLHERGTILGKRDYNENILERRKTFLDRWENDLSLIYNPVEEPPEVPDLN